MAIWRRPKSPQPETAPRPAPAASRPVASRRQDGDAEPAWFCLEASIRLRGELVGTSDVRILGEVDGTVRLEGHDLEVAESGRVTAEITARRVTISGQVVGNVTASEAISISAGGCVLGDLCAPSIHLEDGSRFTGGINRQAAPAKVTGRLSDGGGSGSARREETEELPDHACHGEIPDRCASDWTWGSPEKPGSNR